VITQRIVIGNGSLFSSNIANPSSNLLDSQGFVQNYMKEPSAVANIESLTLEDGEYAYVAETYARGVLTSRGVYSKALF
jgi:hypothetical protein